MNNFSISISVFFVLIIFVGCGVVTDTTLDTFEDNLVDLEDIYGGLSKAIGDDYKDFKKGFMQTFEIEHQVGLEARGLKAILPPRAPALSIKATVPVYTPVTLVDGGSGSFDDYPEPTLTTDYTITDEGSDIFRIVATTTWPDTNNIIDSYVEEYYIKDEAPSGTWTTADPIVRSDGTEDPRHRVRMEMNFDDGSVREETIVRLYYPNAPVPAPSGFLSTGFASFDIFASLDYPDLAFPDTDANADYSSIVVYTHVQPSTEDYSFWTGTNNATILGVRYYTEHSNPVEGTIKGTLVAYEKAVVGVDTTGGGLVGQLEDIFVGSQNAVLAESVFRKEVVFDSTADWPTAIAMNSIMRSHIVDISPPEEDVQLQILNDDALRLLEWEEGTYHIPTGTADEVIASGPSADELDLLSLVQTEASNPDGEDIPLLIVDDQGPSDLATLYRSIIEGAVTNNVDAADDIPGTLDPPAGVYDFDGDVGVSIPDSSDFDLTTDGTVEAWVWVDQLNNWAGIVHKGEKADFSDEAYSLQFWGPNGNVAFAIVQQNPTYNFKAAKSQIRLNIGKWYYLVGTWDADYVTLYIRADGVSYRKQVANTLGEAAVTDGPLVIGSQVLEEQGAHGYYGADGKINAVKVYEGAMTEAEVDAFYDANKDKTVNW